MALIFAGNGLASIVFRRPGQFYAEKEIDVPVNDAMPVELAETLTNLFPCRVEAAQKKQRCRRAGEHVSHAR